MAIMASQAIIMHGLIIMYEAMHNYELAQHLANVC